jgi:hypothetical protein
MNHNFPKCGCVDELACWEAEKAEDDRRIAALHADPSWPRAAASVARASSRQSVAEAAAMTARNAAETERAFGKPAHSAGHTHGHRATGNGSPYCWYHNNPCLDCQGKSTFADMSSEQWVFSIIILGVFVLLALVKFGAFR